MAMTWIYIIVSADGINFGVTDTALDEVTLNETNFHLHDGGYFSDYDFILDRAGRIVGFSFLPAWDDWLCNSPVFGQVGEHWYALRIDSFLVVLIEPCDDWRFDVVQIIGTQVYVAESGSVALLLPVPDEPDPGYLALHECVSRLNSEVQPAPSKAPNHPPLGG
jgi:hypothetical protein